MLHTASDRQDRERNALAYNDRFLNFPHKQLVSLHTALEAHQQQPQQCIDDINNCRSSNKIANNKATWSAVECPHCTLSPFSAYTMTCMCVCARVCVCACVCACVQVSAQSSQSCSNTISRASHIIWEQIKCRVALGCSRSEDVHGNIVLIDGNS